MKLKTKIITTLCLIVLVAVFISTLVGCVTIAQTAGKSVKERVCADTVSFAQQIDTWLLNRSLDVESIAYALEDGKYLTENREQVYDFLVRSSEKMSEFYAIYVGCDDNFARFSDGWIPDPDYIITERQWYQEAKNADKTIITDPYVDATTGRMVITLATAVKTGNTFEGVLAADIFIDELQAICDSFVVVDGSYPILLSQNNTIIIHTNKDYTPYIDGNGEEVHTLYENTYTEKEDAGTTETGNLTYYCKDYTGTRLYVITQALKTTNWTVKYAVDNWVLHADVNMGVFFLFIAVPIVLLVTIVLGILLIRNCFKPLIDIATEVKRLTNGDLTVAFNYKTDDEIGAVCNAIEQSNKTIKQYIDDITQQLAEMENGVLRGCSNLEYIGDFKPIQQTLNRIRSTLCNSFVQIINTTDIVVNGAEAFKKNSDVLATGSTTEMALVDEINNNVAEMTQKVKNTLESTKTATKLATGTVISVQQSNQQMTYLEQAMQEIEKTAEEICVMNKTIEDIAFQTNILALNASVEAARAGVAGKGFAVVADEVRNLASKSAEAATKTNNLIERSTLAVKKGKDYTTTTATALHAVERHTNEITELVSEITTSAEEQEQYIQAISNKIQGVSAQVMQTAATAQESAKDSAELRKQAKDLQSLMKQYKI